MTSRGKAIEALRPFVVGDATAIKEYMAAKPSTWWEPFDYFWGRRVKEFLAEAGYAELADDYVALVEEAVKFK